MDQWWLDKLSVDEHGWMDAIPHEESDLENYDSHIRVIRYCKYEILEKENAELRRKLDVAIKIFNKLIKLESRWDNHGEFYKPTDVDGIKKEIKEAIAELEKGDQNGK